MPSSSAYSLEFREKVAKEAIKGDLSQILIADKYNISRWLVSIWKRAFINGTLPPNIEPLTEADRQAAFRARRAEREQRMAETLERTQEAFKDVLAALVAATSAYETFVGNSRRPGVRDALYATRLKDYQKAIERARKAYAELFEK